MIATPSSSRPSIHYWHPSVLGGLSVLSHVDYPCIKVLIYAKIFNLTRWEQCQREHEVSSGLFRVDVTTHHPILLTLQDIEQDNTHAKA